MKRIKTMKEAIEYLENMEDAVVEDVRKYKYVIHTPDATDFFISKKQLIQYANKLRSNENGN